MTHDPDDTPLSLDNPDETHRLREALDRAGYTPDRIAALLNLRPQELLSPSATSRNKVVSLRRTESGDPLSILIRLFLLGVEVEREAARRALSPSNPEHWLAAGLLRQHDDRVSAPFLLLPFDRLLLAVDLWWGELKPRHVQAIGGPTLDLAQMTVRRHSRSTLDVGTGCGIQAFLAAPHSDAVVGVDRNPRAVNLATFNAHLNGLTHASFLEGDLCSPVQDRRFDLIVANPPYVISPESRFLYRDSGLKGDEISQRVIREGTALLQEGGFLQVICEWAHLAGQDWRSRLAGWFKGSGCDVWVLQFTTVDSAVHAEHWLKSTDQDSPELLRERLQSWLDYHRQEGIEAVSDGVISFRKRSGGNNWLRFDHTPQRVGPCGFSVERGFAAADFLAQNHDDRTLLATRLRLAPEVCWEQRKTPTEDGWKVTHSQLYVASGLAYRGDVDARGMAMVERFRGQRTVGEVLDSLAELDGPLVDVPQALTVLRLLIEQGYLLPA